MGRPAASAEDLPIVAFLATWLHAESVTPDEILKFVQGAARLRQLRVLVGHTTQRMNERNAPLADVREAILTATSASPSDDGPGRWLLIGGIDLDGDPLSVVVKVTGPAVWVVTTF